MVVKRQHKQQLPPFGLKLSWCTFFSLSCVLSFLAFFLRTKLLYRLFHPHDSYIQLFTRELRERERKSALQSQTALVKLCNLINIDTCQFLSNEIFFFVLVVLFRGILCVCVCCVVWRIGYCIHGLFADEQATQSFRNTQCNALSISSNKTVWVELLFDGFDGWKKKDDIENYF